jgi:hypothetical protein
MAAGVKKFGSIAMPRKSKSRLTSRAIRAGSSLIAVR